MKHLGDITKINGAEIEIVDVITGGSPCQDLSIAGKRAGLAGARSGLFMEQVRIVKEVREHDRANGRTGDMVRPRYMVWENVPGAFSSNKGRDFAAVLEEIIRIAEPEAPDIEVPEKGWPTWGGYHDEVGGRWSVAWRVHDAQYWGVPQRRRRISVVADFGGDTAGEILFERKSVSGNPAESGAARERLAGNAEIGASYAVRIRGGCDGGGKGALVQTEKSGTLFEATPINLMVATRCKALGRGTGFGVGEPGDPANTISSAHSHGVFVSEEQSPICMATQQGGAEEQSPTLNAECGGNKPAVLCLNDQGGNVMGVSHDVSGTLRAQEHGHQPAVMAFDTTQITSKQNGSIPDFGKPRHTLNAGDRHGVMCMTPWDAQSQRVYDGNGVSPTLSSRENSGLNREAVLCAGFKAGQGAQAGGIGYGDEVSPTLTAGPSGTNQTPAGVVLDMTHACDVIRECGERAPALQARMGTGGNQVPLVAYGIGNGKANEANVMAEEVSQTLNTMHDAQTILYQPKSVMEENWAESETKNALRAGESKVSHALLANAGCAYREDAETYPVQNMVVRRLTPMECERLQGFPDGWTDIGEWRDSKGKLRKPSDSPRYKALGNSIALPFWDFLAKRISAQYIRPVTMGSLFDGIGGFPLVFERHNGKGTARWASEIEEFPIAVTKLRFGED